MLMIISSSFQSLHYFSSLLFVFLRRFLVEWRTRSIVGVHCAYFVYFSVLVVCAKLSDIMKVSNLKRAITWSREQVVRSYHPHSE